MEFLRAVFWSENKNKNIIILYNTNKRFSIAPVAFTLPLSPKCILKILDFILFFQIAFDRLMCIITRTYTSHNHSKNNNADIITKIFT